MHFPYDTSMVCVVCANSVMVLTTMSLSNHFPSDLGFSKEGIHFAAMVYPMFLAVLRGVIKSDQYYLNNCMISIM